MPKAKKASPRRGRSPSPFPDGVEFPSVPHEGSDASEEEDFWWKRGIWQQPRQVVHWNHTIEGVHSKGVAEPGRKVSWSELFFDLVLVTNVAKLGEAYQEGHVNLLQVALLYRVLFDSWLTATVHACRFFTDDISAKITMGALMFMLVMAGLKLGEPFPESSANFCYFSAVFHLVQIIPNLRAYSVMPKLRAFIFREAIVSGLGKAAILFVASWSENPALVCTFLAAMIVIQAVWLSVIFGCMRLPKVNRPPVHVDHVIERRGCLRLIVLGEVITGVTVNACVVNCATVVLVLLGFLLVFNMKLLAFDVDIVPIHRHAYRVGGALRPIAFLEMATLFEGAMALMGSCIKIVLSVLLMGEADPGYLRSESAHLTLCACVAVGILALTVERLSHEQEHTFFAPAPPKKPEPLGGAASMEQDGLLHSVPDPTLAMYGAITKRDDPEGELDDDGICTAEHSSLMPQVQDKKLARQIWLLQILTHVLAMATASGLAAVCLHIHEEYEFLLVLGGLWIITCICIVVDLLDECLLY